MKSANIFTFTVQYNLCNHATYDWHYMCKCSTVCVVAKRISALSYIRIQGYVHVGGTNKSFQAPSPRHNMTIQDIQTINTPTFGLWYVQQNFPNPSTVCALHVGKIIVDIGTIQGEHSVVRGRVFAMIDSFIAPLVIKTFHCECERAQMLTKTQVYQQPTHAQLMYMFIQLSFGKSSTAMCIYAIPCRLSMNCTTCMCTLMVDDYVQRGSPLPIPIIHRTIQVQNILH